MDRLILFIQSNLTISFAFALCLLAYLALEFYLNASSSFVLSPQAFVSKMNEKPSKIIDLRSEDAFTKFHIAHSLSYPKAKVDTLKESFKSNLQQKLLFVCQQGDLSKKLVSQLRKAGFDQTYALSGGLSNWQKENLPLKKQPQA